MTPRQIEAAAKIKVESDDLSLELLGQLDRLCIEYDSIRRTMPAGPSRTQAMTRIVVKMRVLAPSLISHIEVYKGSGSAGSRLAAIAIMQMNPNTCDVQWLVERFFKEAPFLFYHAALAMQNLANGALSNMEWDELHGGTVRALNAVRMFKGKPDQSTIDVLEALIADYSKH